MAGLPPGLTLDSTRAGDWFNSTTRPARRILACSLSLGARALCIGAFHPWHAIPEPSKPRPALLDPRHGWGGPPILDHGTARVSGQDCHRLPEMLRYGSTATMARTGTIPVIDLFAGPGGLGEGFSQLRDVRGRSVFRIALSIEMDEYAHRTLRLRSFFRQFEHGNAPSEYYSYLRGDSQIPSVEALFARFGPEAEAASAEAWRATLGKTPFQDVSAAISTALTGVGKTSPWIMIGGPPCQAYSTVGRSRMIGEIGHRAFYQDKRHTLYREYLRLIRGHEPVAFIMENVKGLLSSRLHDALILKQILKDLRRPKPGVEYILTGLSVGDPTLFGNVQIIEDADPEQFLIHSEKYGIPQCRHRLIVVGIRKGFAPFKRRQLAPLSAHSPQPTCRLAIEDLPSLRSGLSREEDSNDEWLRVIREAATSRFLKQLSRNGHADIAESIMNAIDRAVVPRSGRGRRFISRPANPLLYPKWFVDERLEGICNHETRSHIAPDLWRYLFAACFGEIRGVSPRIRDFPKSLLPHHANIGEAVASRMFNDRFRVQVWDRPSTTVTAHISKDGHYFIHPDPRQVRSLTVREAARLQTFPDNYVFEGPRTEQYRQVGNAVPPLLARQIAASVASLFDPSLTLEPDPRMT